MSLQNSDGSYNVTLQATSNQVGAVPMPIPITAFPLANGYEMSVAMEPNQILWEDWGTGSPIDTVNKWQTPSLSTGTSTPSVGQEVLASSTTASAWAFLQSQYAFPGRNPGYNFAQMQMQFETGNPINNAYRFWGFATIPTTPTAVAPIIEGVGFEINVNGKMSAVTWSTGTRNPIQDMSSTGNNSQPTDGATHKYEVFFRGDNIVWYIDGKVVAQTLTGALGPNVNTLFLSFLTVAGTTPPGISATITIAQASVGDTSRNAQRIVDGTYNWRAATVTPQGQQVVGNLTPGTPITASATGTTAAITATLAGVANKTTYLTGLQVTSSGASAAGATTVTVTGTISGSLNYVVTQGAIAATGTDGASLIVPFPSPIPASAVNTAIAATTTLVAGTTAGAVTLTGFQL